MWIKTVDDHYRESQFQDSPASSITIRGEERMNHDSAKGMKIYLSLAVHNEVNVNSVGDAA